MGNLKTLLKKSKAASRNANKNKGKVEQKTPDAKERQALENVFAEGRYAEVADLAREMTIRFPRDGFGWKVLGVVHNQTGNLSEALDAMNNAVALSPADAEAHSNLGSLLQSAGQAEKAIKKCRKAIQLQPNFAAAHRHLGDALHDIGQLDEAVKSYRRALKINPDYPEAYNNMGVVLLALDRADEAIKSYHRALKINPAFTEARNNLGTALQHLGRREDGLKEYRQALENNPNFAQAHSNLLFALSHDETVGAQSLFAEHRRFAQRYEIPLRDQWPEHTNARIPDRCLRVGFVSADLRDHAVAGYIEPILTHLAKSAHMSIFAYSNNTVEDNVTRRLQQYPAHWRRIANLTDAALVQTIQDDGIDILIDLSGHTAGNRLPVFASKPAPIQVSWIGYPGTTGLTAVDYYLTDRFFLPPGHFDDQFTEKLVYLPASVPFSPMAEAPPVSPLPALRHGYITFGSFNRADKLSPAVIALWAQLLLALPDARLVLGGLPIAAENEMLVTWFEQEGIERERLQFYGRCPMTEYLALYHRVDICLDTFPYNGSTTTCHALWMGVPVLTMPRSTAPGRVGAWALNHTGLESFVVSNKGDFVSKGIRLAENLAELARIRRELRDRLRQSSLCQPSLVAHSLEQALRIMWQRWCAGLPAESFEAGSHDKKNMAQEFRS
ncbi:MAG: tetratricopeptide repeat protein [Desulfobulbus sp.]